MHAARKISLIHPIPFKNIFTYERCCMQTTETIKVRLESFIMDNKNSCSADQGGGHPPYIDPTPDVHKYC